jgi:hypothetical protein
MKTYKTTSKTLVVIFFLLFSQLVFSQSDKIPWLPLIKDAPQKTADVITSAQIGISVYPGAYLTSYYPATSSNESDKSVTSLATVFLVTSDEIEKVVQFYIKNLKKSDGWNFYDEYNVFVKGDLNDALSRTVPGVAIREETGENFDLADADPDIKSTLKTRIKILYKP